MDQEDVARQHPPYTVLLPALRLRHEAAMAAIVSAFDDEKTDVSAGAAAVKARSDAVDRLVRDLASSGAASEGLLDSGVAVVALGGYGRGELFPYSDVDLMVLFDDGGREAAASDRLAVFNQALWDAGLRVNSIVRTIADCGRFDRENVEFTLSLFDARHVAGDARLAGRLCEEVVPRLIARDRPKVLSRLLDVTRKRRARYGDTLFHLEPDTKDCPGGLRDAHVCRWLTRLMPELRDRCDSPDFFAAREFLVLIRVFLHFRHLRDENTLEWQAQDAAAAAALGIGREEHLNAAAWMRHYFRYARAIDSCLRRLVEDVTEAAAAQHAGESNVVAISGSAGGLRTDAAPPPRPGSNTGVPGASLKVEDPKAVLSIFAAMAATGARLPGDVEARIVQGLPVFSARLEDGPKLWQSMRAILAGGSAGLALRSMHALGVLEVVFPEFHAIDALVIRDAYHRYTVDEHTFVVIDTLQDLRFGQDTQETSGNAALAQWKERFGQVLCDLPHPELLMLAALLHDTGKAHVSEEHALRSAAMAEKVAERLALDRYETALVVTLVRNHLQMSNTLRRDIFDQETIRSFVQFAPDPESLRMLTLLTLADIAAVHPDALTAWKAENLWHLYNAASAWLDRNVDEERVTAEMDSQFNELLIRVHAIPPRARVAVNAYLEGFPRRYLQTRDPRVIRSHVQMAAHLADADDGVELALTESPEALELTLVSRDRPRLFSLVAGALAAWSMNITHAEAFANAQGIVVDTFRFTDTFRALELNVSERERFTDSVRQIIAGKVDLAALLASRKRGRRTPIKVKVDTNIQFDDTASSHSTLLQVVAQDAPGLLHALSLEIAQHDCSIEVALVDTEGEAAIDVFYITHAGQQVDSERKDALRAALLGAVDENAK